MASGDKAKCREKLACVVIRRLVNLIEHPISKYAIDRHLDVLTDFLNSTHYAFWLQDISYIIRLYEHIVRHLDTIPNFKEPLECLLQYSAIPPMMTKMSDQFYYQRDLQEYFSTLGYMIACLHEQSLQKLVLTALKSLLDPKPPIGYCCVPLESCKLATERSRLPEILAELLQIVDEAVYPDLLEVFYLTCQISTTACQKMLAENAVEFLLQRFEPTSRNRDENTKPKKPTNQDHIPIFDDTCCILWRLLNAADRSKVQLKNPSLFALWSLHYALEWTLVAPGQRANRNNLIALILKIILTFPDTNFAESDICDDIVILATTVAGCTCHKPLVVQEDTLDYQFKKIVLACLHFCQTCAGVNEAEILKALMKHFYQEHTADRKHIEQYCKLSTVMLKLIPKYLCYSSNIFLAQRGPNKIIKAIDNYLMVNYDSKVLLAYIYCLHKMLELKIDDILKVVIDNNTANTIIDVCENVLEVETLSKTYQKILGHVFCILQILYTLECSKEVKTIDVVIKYLNRVIEPKELDPIIDVRVTMCAIHLLWDVISSKSFHKKFLKAGGIYILLDIIKASIYPIKSLALGVLADMSKKSSCVPYFITWRKNGSRVMSTLLEIFRNKPDTICDCEENNEVCERANFWLALCQNQKISVNTDCMLKENLMEKTRCRIFGILYVLKVRFRKNVEIANGCYKLFPEELSTDNKLALVFAENFFSLKMCEAWVRIFKEIKTEKITLVDVDYEQLTETIKSIRNWKLYLQCVIARIIKKEAHDECQDEMNTYSILKNARLSDALDALKELKFVSTCTEKIFQMHRKFTIQSQITIDHGGRSASFHKTINELTFTNIYNQTISIQSNTIYEQSDDEDTIELVSAYSNEVLECSDEDHDLTDPPLSC